MAAVSTCPFIAVKGLFSEDNDPRLGFRLRNGQAVGLYFLRRLSLAGRPNGGNAGNRPVPLFRPKGRRSLLSQEIQRALARASLRSSRYKPPQHFLVNNLAAGADGSVQPKSLEHPRHIFTEPQSLA
jgi:hypothetical protein